MRTLFTLILICLATTAMAGNRVEMTTVTPLDPSNIKQLDSSLIIESDFVLGNTNPPINKVVDWAYGNESYTSYAPMDQADVCFEGFAPLNVTSYMAFGPEDVPATFAVEGALRVAVDDGTGCLKPGDRLVSTPTYLVTIDEPGDWQIVLPFDEADLICVPSNTSWFAEFKLPESFPDGMFPDILVDDMPQACASWYEFFLLGWEDLAVDYSWPGSAVVHIEAACCENSVATEIQSLGSLKCIYR